MIEFDGTTNSEESRKGVKKSNADKCIACGKEESEENDDVTLVKCGICKHYVYFGKDCDDESVYGDEYEGEEMDDDDDDDDTYDKEKKKNRKK